MTNSDIILRLIEMLLAERDKNYQLREDNKKGKTNTQSKGGKIHGLPPFIILIKNSMCIHGTHTMYRYVQQ